jgi:glycopeptide antibiotics resistance protein
MLRGPVYLEISRPLIAVWLMPAVGMLLALIAMRNAPPRSHAKVVNAVRLMLLGYLVGAIVLTLWPLELDLSVVRVENGNWSPFNGTLGFLISDNELQNTLGGRDVLANIVLFTPFGLLLPYAFYQWRGVPVSALFIAFLAFGLELTQGLLIAERTFDIDDAIAGFVGGVVALAVASLLRPVAHRRV